MLSEFKRWYPALTNYNRRCQGRCDFDWTAFSNHRGKLCSTDCVWQYQRIEQCVGWICEKPASGKARKAGEFTSTPGENVNSLSDNKAKHIIAPRGLVWTEQSHEPWGYPNDRGTGSLVSEPTHYLCYNYPEEHKVGGNYHLAIWRQLKRGKEMIRLLKEKTLQRIGFRDRCTHIFILPVADTWYVYGHN